MNQPFGMRIADQIASHMAVRTRAGRAPGLVFAWIPVVVWSEGVLEAEVMPDLVAGNLARVRTAVAPQSPPHYNAIENATRSLIRHIRIAAHLTGGCHTQLRPDVEEPIRIPLGLAFKAARPTVLGARLTPPF